MPMSRILFRTAVRFRGNDVGAGISCADFAISEQPKNYTLACAHSFLYGRATRYTKMHGQSERMPHTRIQRPVAGTDIRVIPDRVDRPILIADLAVRSVQIGPLGQGMREPDRKLARVPVAGRAV